MGKRDQYRKHCDPEVQRWIRRYPRFPGVAECVRLIQAGRATGTWADILVEELAENAADCLEELIAAFRSDIADESTSGSVAMYVMMALDIALLPASIEFLAQVMREGHPKYIPFARNALQTINTRESRTALFLATHDRPPETPES